ncbi:MAG: DivIVA domain-containing protein [Acidimicrobiales bacterium]|jgi:DivIVA domain-containing protein
MPEERMRSITSSSHLAPDDVARHTFGSVRRGFDPNEVRAYLESLAVGLQAIAERENQLIQEVADAEHRAANPVLDDAALTAALGTETARVLHSAHEAAEEIVAKADAEATRLLTEAHEEVERTRTQAETRLSEHRATADAAVSELLERTNQEAAAEIERARNEADDLLSTAREQCRAMVDEAQGLRSRVLADLSKRRKVLHAQIEQLRAGRERLTETVQDVRRSIDTIAEDLFAAEDNARLAAEEAGRQAAGRPDEGTPEEVAALLLAEEAAASADAELLRVTPAAPVEGDEAVGTVELVEMAEVDVRGDEVGTASGGEPPAAGGSASGPGSADDEQASTEESPVDALFAKIRAAREDADSEAGDPAPGEAAGEPDAGGDETPGLAPTDDGQEEAEDEPDDEDDQPPDERNPLAVRRDELIDPIVISLARRLKRTLQDSQNELLDSLRSGGSPWSIQLLPDETEHVDGYATAALPALEQAAAAGVMFAGPEATQGPRTDVLVGIAHDLAEAVVGPLRRRLSDDEAGLADADEGVVAEHVGSAFREWKGERIERLAGDHVVSAFSAGTMAAVADAQLEWVAVAGSGDAPCPDCEDNGLSGAQQPGQEFPTGHLRPPAHPGCRCLLTRSST